MDIWEYSLDFQDDNLEIQFISYPPSHLKFTFNINVEINKDDELIEILGNIMVKVDEYYSRYNVDEEGCLFVENNKQLMQVISLRHLIYQIECREALIRILSSEIKTIYNNLKENK